MLPLNILYFQEEFRLYGIDWDGPSSLEREEATVEVPKINSPISDDELLLLERSIEPTAESNCFGADIYEKVLAFIEQFT